MKDHHINIFYSTEDAGYIADIPDLTYCSAFGNTPASGISCENCLVRNCQSETESDT